MDRKIAGFHQDEQAHWVAELECGHNQHVRHDPPWQNRPWTQTAEGREGVKGQVLPCRKCEQGAPRDWLPRRRILALSGPVGAGKSTTAKAMTALLNGQGLRAACIDLDLLYGMARQAPGFGDADTWAAVHRGAAALSRSFLDGAVDIVIVEGGFHEAADLHALETASAAAVHLVALNLSYERALAQIAADPDPGRVASRNPAVLRRLHAQFSSALPYLRSRGEVIDVAEDESAQALAARVIASFLRAT